MAVPVRRLFLVVVVPVAVGYAVFGLSRTDAAAPAARQDQAATERPFSVTASRYKFDPPRIVVDEDDLVKIDLRTLDIAHSMTIDAYRIAKRVNAGRPIAFEFRADKAGTFPFYCNLQTEDGCRQMKGELIVRSRR